VYSKLLFSTSHSLPGNVPVVDHLYVRAREESAWCELLPAIQSIRNNRVPVQPRHVEITIGSPPNDEVVEFVERVESMRRSIEDSFGFCRFAADTESIMIPAYALCELHRTRKSVSFIQPLPWSGQKDVIAIPVRFMFGHADLTVHLRVPIARGLHVYGRGEPVSYLTLEPLELQPGLQAVIDAAGPLAGVGIHEDLVKFNKLLEILTGQRLNFKPSIDVAVVARLAGFNLPCHGVANLVWTLLGSVSPRGLCP
jgi:hypothetical protein